RFALGGGSAPAGAANVAERRFPVRSSVSAGLAPAAVRGRFPAVAGRRRPPGSTQGREWTCRPALRASPPGKGDPAMLVLTRREEQKIVFPSMGVTVEVLRIRGNVAKIG